MPSVGHGVFYEGPSYHLKVEGDVLERDVESGGALGEGGFVSRILVGVGYEG
ncbi:hypothetical protein [Pelagicoccus mobilis]|uniref:hypothetical protein n=1 Tax=Pelagicoccus mobilis TaxID=415221 RepID=UPI0019075C72|nr:hypothetical protein [Pelagicoccus mobilis]